MPNDHTRAKCTQVIITGEVGGDGVAGKDLPCDVSWPTGGKTLRCTHVHPASAIFLAYIFPMSPMPMMPTTASPMMAVALLRAQQNDGDEEGLQPAANIVTANYSHTQQRICAVRMMAESCEVMLLVVKRRKEVQVARAKKSFSLIRLCFSIGLGGGIMPTNLNPHRIWQLQSFLSSRHEVTSSRPTHHPVDKQQNGTKEEGRARCDGEHLPWSPGPRG